MTEQRIDHNRKFIEANKVYVENYEWLNRLRHSATEKGVIQPIEMCTELLCEDLWVNDAVVINGDVLARVLPDGQIRLVRTKNVNALGVTPRGFEQYFAMDLLLDKDVQCVTLWGIAGSGKTFLALAAALHLVNKGAYDSVHLLKPVSPLGRTSGYLPGTAEEKLSPVLASMTQHLEKIMGQHNSEELVNAVQEEGVEYQRGRNYENSILIIDEAQNMNRHEMLTMLTRLHESSKIFICGDTSQVDDGRIRAKNGLGMVIEEFRQKQDTLIADVQFFKSERKGISLLAVERLTENI